VGVAQVIVAVIIIVIAMALEAVDNRCNAIVAPITMVTVIVVEFVGFCIHLLVAAFFAWACPGMVHEVKCLPLRPLTVIMRFRFFFSMAAVITVAHHAVLIRADAVPLGPFTIIMVFGFIITTYIAVTAVFFFVKYIPASERASCTFLFSVFVYSAVCAFGTDEVVHLCYPEQRVITNHAVYGAHAYGYFIVVSPFVPIGYMHSCLRALPV
jgi:hypothetical protein